MQISNRGCCDWLSVIIWLGTVCVSINVQGILFFVSAPTDLCGICNLLQHNRDQLQLLCFFLTVPPQHTGPHIQGCTLSSLRTVRLHLSVPEIGPQTETKTVKPCQ
ncbi:hypothetical protein GOODEAATRI_024380 [Goodea atripinnis]|uniref:Secreted protein n=1 Tax=Goodea atripinnis TaxID=208336 RepID=A0ABV0NXA8_9TELE